MRWQRFPKWCFPEFPGEEKFRLVKRGKRRWHTEKYVIRQMRIGQHYDRFRWLAADTVPGLRRGYVGEAMAPVPTDGQGRLVVHVSDSNAQWHSRWRGMCKKKALYDCGRKKCPTCHYEKFYGPRHKTRQERLGLLDYAEQMDDAGLGDLVTCDARYHTRRDPAWVQHGLDSKDHKTRQTIILS